MQKAVITLLCMLSASSVMAQDSVEKATALGAKNGFSSGSIMETAGGLVLVLLVIVGLAWLFKRVGHLPHAGKGMLRVVGGVSVGSREKVVVVEIDKQRLVLGVAPGRVQMLHILESTDDDKNTAFAKELSNELKEHNS